MKTRADQAIREALGDFLAILEHKVRSGAINMDDTRVILEAIKAAGGVKATVKDLASYYNQSEDNIRHVIHRNLLPAPRRMVYYDFGSFRKKVPPRWTKRDVKLVEVAVNWLADPDYPYPGEKVWRYING